MNKTILLVFGLLMLASIVSVLYNQSRNPLTKTKATKYQFEKCYEKNECLSLDCRPDSPDAIDCLTAKNQYLACTWDKDICIEASNAMDTVLPEDPLPDSLYTCCQTCKQDPTLSKTYTAYTQCFWNCMWV